MVPRRFQWNWALRMGRTTLALTPALTPAQGLGEGESFPDSWHRRSFLVVQRLSANDSKAGTASQMKDHANNAFWFLPLLGGEGRGEGGVRAGLFSRLHWQATTTVQVLLSTENIEEPNFFCTHFELSTFLCLLAPLEPLSRGEPELIDRQSRCSGTLV